MRKSREWDGGQDLDTTDHYVWQSFTVFFLMTEPEQRLLPCHVGVCVCVTVCGVLVPLNLRWEGRVESN